MKSYTLLFTFVIGKFLFANEMLSLNLILSHTERVIEISKKFQEMELQMIAEEPDDKSTRQLDRSLADLTKQIRTLRKQSVSTRTTIKDLQSELQKLAKMAGETANEFNRYKMRYGSDRFDMVAKAVADVKSQLAMLQKAGARPNLQQEVKTALRKLTLTDPFEMAKKNNAYLESHTFKCVAFLHLRHRGDEVKGLFKAMLDADTKCNPNWGCDIVSCYNRTINEPVPGAVMKKYIPIYRANYGNRRG